MAIAERTGSTTWEGSLARGSGTTTSGSGALGRLPVTWASRTEEPGGKTSPEELAAAAHSACFAQALSLKLAENGTPPERLNVDATLTLDEVDGRPTVVSSALQVSARVPGMDTATFDRSITETTEFCPISRLFAGARITVDATLEDA